MSQSRSESLRHSQELNQGSCITIQFFCPLSHPFYCGNNRTDPYGASYGSFLDDSSDGASTTSFMKLRRSQMDLPVQRCFLLSTPLPSMLITSVRVPHRTFRWCRSVMGHCPQILPLDLLRISRGCSIWAYGHPSTSDCQIGALVRVSTVSC